MILLTRYMYMYSMFTCPICYDCLLFGLGHLKKKILRGFIKFLCRRSVGFFSQAFLVFLTCMKESKKRRRKQLGKLMAKFRSQLVNLPIARPLMNPLNTVLFHLCIRLVVSLYTVNGTIKSRAELKY